jgi:hypothetical protein
LGSIVWACLAGRVAVRGSSRADTLSWFFDPCACLSRHRCQLLLARARVRPTRPKKPRGHRPHTTATRAMVMVTLLRPTPATHESADRALVGGSRLVRGFHPLHSARITLDRWPNDKECNFLFFQISWVMKPGTPYATENCSLRASREFDPAQRGT